ncbi:MAG: hypothetical protein V4558_08645 [Gemmatimonadota bacterium]
MTRTQPPTATRRDCGFALALALLAVILLGGFAAVALVAASARLRLAGDLRIAIEGDLQAASALAERRVNADSVLVALTDGDRIDFGTAAVGSGWWAHSIAWRTGTLVQLSTEVTLRNDRLQLVGARRATLLIGVVAADTLRVSGYRSRY